MFKCRMFVKTLLLVVVVAGTAAFTARAQQMGHDTSATAAPENAPALPKCPVSGEDVNLAVSLQTDEGPVFFCCNDCVSKYRADTKKYMAAVTAQRKVLAQRPKIQVACPVSGEPVDMKASTEYKGQKVYFCCKDCIHKFEGDPSKYQSALANSYTYQTKCPITGESIDPKAYSTLSGGEKVYFCCPRCQKSLFAEPDKYAAKLKDQGYDFKPATLRPGKTAGESAGGAHEDDHHEGHDHDGHDH